MPRAIVLVMDSFGIGSAPDAARFGDDGADTFGHIAEACYRGRADKAGLREGALALPNLVALGLGEAAKIATGRIPPGLEGKPLHGAWGAARERSKGKDTPSGHWEMAGVPVLFDWGYFPREVPAFPAALTDALAAQCGVAGFLGNCHASGTEIIDELGEEHMASGKPIIYTSADSVFQIAAHEKTFGLQRLYECCVAARKLVDELNVGRVIARPFVGDAPGNFRRTGNRKDYTVPPPSPTLLDRASGEGRMVLSVGKIADIFSHSGTGEEIKASGHPELWEKSFEGLRRLGDGGIMMTNFVDFDMLYGHRRDVAGYAAALEEFDARLPAFLNALSPGDLLVITADHGCDPTWAGTDHTREYVPVLAYEPGMAPRSLGLRESFADIAATLARHLDLSARFDATPW